MPDDPEYTAGCLNCGNIGSIFASDNPENIICGQCRSSNWMVSKTPDMPVEWLVEFFESRLKIMVDKS